MARINLCNFDRIKQQFMILFDTFLTAWQWFFFSCLHLKYVAQQRPNDGFTEKKKSAELPTEKLLLLSNARIKNTEKKKSFLFKVSIVLNRWREIACKRQVSNLAMAIEIVLI